MAERRLEYYGDPVCMCRNTCAGSQPITEREADQADQSAATRRPQVERDELSLFNVATQGIMDAWNLLKNLILITIEYLGLRKKREMKRHKGNVGGDQYGEAVGGGWWRWRRQRWVDPCGGGGGGGVLECNNT